MPTEALQAILDSQKQVLQKLDNLSANIVSIDKRVSIIEAKNGHRMDDVEDNQHKNELRLHDLEIHKQSVNRTGTMALDSILKVIWTVIAAVIAYHLGVRP